MLEEIGQGLLQGLAAALADDDHYLGYGVATSARVVLRPAK